MARLDPALPLRVIGDVLAGLSRDRAARGGEAIRPEDVRAAAEAGPEAVERLALEYVLHLGQPRYTVSTLAALAGLPVDELRRLWLALGFAEADPDEPVFTDGDLVAVRDLRGLFSEGVGARDAVALARVVGESFARISDGLVRLMQQATAAQLDDPDVHDVELVVALAANASSDMTAIDDILSHTWKRHLAAAIRRASLRGMDTSAVEQCVGFADIAGFTSLAATVGDHELGGILDQFQTCAYQAVVVGRARLVKTVGDQVMFIAETPDVAMSIAGELVTGFDAGARHIDLHIGLAFGHLLPRDGDFFGRTVNLASRLCDAATGRTALIDDRLREALGHRGRDARPAIRDLPGLGPTRVWLLDASGLATALS